MPEQHRDLDIGERFTRLFTGLGNAAVQIPGFFTDLITTPQDDYDAFHELVRSRAIARGSNAIDHAFQDASGLDALYHNTPVQRGVEAAGGGVAGALESFDELSGNLIRENVSTGLLAPQLAQTRHADYSPFDSDTWSTAKELSQDISMGQAAFHLIAGTDVLDQDEMERWADSDLFHYATGTLDMVGRMMFDLDVLLFRGARRFRDDYWKPTIKDTRRQQQIQSLLHGRQGKRIDDWIESLPDDVGAAARQIKNRHFGRDVQGWEKAYHLASAPDSHSRQLVWRVMMGDHKALKQVQQMHGAHLERASALGELQQMGRDRSRLQNLMAGTQEMFPGTKRMFPVGSKAEKDRLAAIQSRLERNVVNQSGALKHLTPERQVDAKFRLLNDPNRDTLIQAEINDTMRAVGDLETLGRLAQTQDRFVRQGFTGSVRENIVNSRIYQQSPFTKPIRLMSERRPHAMVDIEDMNSTEMLDRMLRQAEVSDSQRNQLVSQMSRTTDPIERTNLWDRAQIVGFNNLVKNVNARHGTNLDANFADDMIREQTNLARQHVQRQYSAGNHDLIRTETPEGIDLVRAPIFRSQTPNVVFTPNFTGMKETLEQYAKKGHLPDPGSNVTDLAPELGDMMMRYWKAHVLLRPAWPIRVTGFDETWRTVAKYGALSSMPAIRHGARNFVRSTARELGMENPTRAGRAGAAAGGVMGFLAAGVPGAGVGAAAGMGGMRVVSNLAKMERAGLDWSKLGKLGIERPFGAPGDKANVFLDRASSRAMLTRFLREDDQYADIMKVVNDRDPRRWETIPGDDPRHLEDWERVINAEFRGDELAERIMRGDEFEDLVRWLESPEGVRYARNMTAHEIQNPRDWVRKAQQAVDETFPGDAGPRLRQLALDRPVNAEDLTSLYPNSQARPPIHGEALADAFGRSAIKQAHMKVDGFIEKGMRLLGQFPTDELVRYPGFEVAYKRWFERYLNANFPGWEDASRVNMSQAELATAHDAARRKALASTRDLAYDLAERSEFHHLIRHIHPFAPAVQEVLSTWGGLAIENPVFATRAVKAWFSLDNIEGVSWEDPEDGSKWLTFPVTEDMKGIVNSSPIFRGALDDQGFIRFPKQGFNLIIQSPFGLGPFVQASTSEIVRRNPSLEGDLEPILNTFMPFGVSKDFGDAWLSTYGKRSRAMIERWLGSPEASDEYQTYFMRAWGQSIADMREGRRPMIDFDEPEQVRELENEITDKTDALFALRTVSGFVSPAQPVFESPFWMHEQALREMIRAEEEMDPLDRHQLHQEHGSPFERMLDAYGDELAWVLQSRTRSNDGIPSDLEALEKRENFRNLVEKYPEFGGVIIGRDIDSQELQWSRATMDYQMREPLRPGDSTKMRERLDPREFHESADTRVGWLKYSRFLDWLDAERIDRGLPNLQVKEAEDLAALKRTVRDQIAAEHPEWGQAQNEELTLPAAKRQRRIEFLREATSDPDLGNRPDMVGAKKYLEAFDWMNEQLCARAHAGGPKTLDAAANIDLQLQWDTMTSSIIDSPEGVHFAPMFHRFLEHVQPACED